MNFFLDSYYLCYGTDLFFFGHSLEVLVTHTKDLGQIIHDGHIAVCNIGGGYIDVHTAIAFVQVHDLRECQNPSKSSDYIHHTPNDTTWATSEVAASKHECYQNVNKFSRR